jgi:glycosyltransferase involved in cell wall biosynthesis
VADTRPSEPRTTISVVIPSYNGATYIRDAIASALQQTALPDEIIVADDCSRDGTISEVEDLARTAAVPIRIIRTTRNSGGPARPINAAVQAATSDLVAVLEQDDRLTPTRIARSLEAAKLLPSAGLICGRVRMRSSTGSVRDDLWKDGHLQFADLSLTPIAPGIYRAESADLFLSLLHRNIVFTNSNSVFPRSIWKRVGGFDPRYPICADLDFNLKVARVSPFAVIDDVLCEYHQRHDSLYNRNVDPTGHSAAYFEATFIRMRHALQNVGPSSDLAEEWYWEARQLLTTAWRRHDWKRACSILCKLGSSGVLHRQVMRKLRRLVQSP